MDNTAKKVVVSARLPQAPDRSLMGAFTLVELLVTIAVIAILASLLLPSLSLARKRSQNIHCLSNTRQLGLGMKLYADNDPRGKLPGIQSPAFGLSPWSWVYGLSAYLGNVEQVRICPSDAQGPLRRREHGSSYVLNEYTSTDPEVRVTRSVVRNGVTGPDGETAVFVTPVRRVDALSNPSGTILLFEGSELGALIGDERTHPDTWFLGWSNVVADIDPFRHGRAANYLFADWHVESIAGSRLRARLEQGDHFAAPR